MTELSRQPDPEHSKEIRSFPFRFNPKLEGFTLLLLLGICLLPLVMPYIKKGPLSLTLSEDLKKSLNEKKIPQELRQNFQDQKIPLSDQGVVEVVKAGEEWIISDQKGKKWQLQKEGSALKIRKKKEKKALDGFEKKMEKALKENPIMMVLLVVIQFFLPLILCLSFWIYFFFMKLDEKTFFPARDRTPPPWGILDIFRVIFFFLFCQIYLSLAIHQIDLGGLSPHYRGLFLGNGISLLVFFFLLFLTHRVYKAPWKALGIQYQKGITPLIRGFMGYFMITPLIFGALFLSQYLGKYYEIEFEPHPIVEFVSQGGPWLMVYLFLVACVLAPVVEEFFFRAFTYPALREKIGRWPAMIGVSFFFAFLHPGFHSVFPIFVLGMFLVYLYDRTESIWACILVHSLNNGLTMAKLFLVKELL